MRLNLRNLASDLGLVAAVVMLFAAVSGVGSDVQAHRDRAPLCWPWGSPDNLQIVAMGEVSSQRDEERPVAGLLPPQNRGDKVACGDSRRGGYRVQLDTLIPRP